jgi:hypothetical protein
MRFRTRVRTALLIGAIGVAASGCATTHAKSAPDAPPLDMPPPPPRAIEPSDTEPPPPIALPDEPEHHPPARRVPSPSPKPEATKPEPPKPETPPIVEPPKPAEEPPKSPPTTLQTAPAGRETEEEQRIRAQLSRAMADLNRIDYRALNADARTQYDTAKRFVTQAEDALKAKNLVFARSVADKAAALAAQLGGK